MRILHYYDNGDQMVSQHVKMLTDNMGLEADIHSATESEQARTLLKGGSYDVLHLHGCWRNSSKGIVTMALHQGARLVLTPHGQLEPWVQEERRWKEKLPKQLLYQRDIVERAYAVIIQGRMEQECMEKLGWNPRTAVIRNAVITSSITPKDMARQTYAVYRKVMDSDPRKLMTANTLELLKAIITAGITGDRRWLDANRGAKASETVPPAISNDQWRLLLCYAHQEQIMDTVQRGIRVLQLACPDIDAEKIAYFVPTRHKQTDSIQQAIGNQFPTENDRLTASFRYLRKLDANRALSIKHLVELDSELRHHGCEEERLGEELKERHLWKLASRTMQLMADMTGLTEGFMPIAPTNDRTTRRMRTDIENHLTI